MLTIDRIIETMPYGKTKPIKVKASDGNVYVVKFRTDSMSRRDRSITNEFIAYKVLQKLGWNIAPLELRLIEIDELSIELAEDADIHPESLSQMRKSLGPNIAIPFLDACEKAVEINNQSFIKKVCTIDNIMLNDDREADNPNILIDLIHHNRFYAIDWGLAMEKHEVYKDIQRGEIDSRMMYYQTCNVVRRPHYLFRHALTRESLSSQEIEDIIQDTIDEIPIEWDTCSAKDTLVEILAIRATSKKIFE